MTDWTHRCAESPESVALKLMHEIAKVEGRLDHHRGARPVAMDRQWILDTFSECLEAVRGQRTLNGRDNKKLGRIAADRAVSRNGADKHS